MTVDTNNNNRLNNRVCPVCGDEISHFDTLSEEYSRNQACRASQCNEVMRRRADMSEQLFTHHLQFQRKIIAQTRADKAAQKARTEKFLIEQKQQEQRILDRAVHALPQLSRNNTHALSIPNGRTNIGPLPQERIDSYRQNLSELIEEARGYENAQAMPRCQNRSVKESGENFEETFQQHEQFNEVAAKLCITCKGSCCLSGGAHAYLSSYTLRRFMDSNPQLSDTEILDCYLSRLIPETIVGGCVNQSKTRLRPTSRNAI